jgi:5S rRNA maturation endonuclease (ribonuclease M5)
MPVIVEGKKDVAALRRVGIDANVVSIGKGQSIFTFCEELSREHKSAVILTDWDRKGGHLARTIKEALEANGVKPLDSIRTQLVLLCKKEIKDIESLPTFVSRLRAETGSM